MGLGRSLGVSGLSLLRDVWEVRVKKHHQRQKKEQERVEQSALPKIDQQWQYRIYCKTLKTKELNLLHRYLERSTPTGMEVNTTEAHELEQEDPEQSRLVFKLVGDQWADFPGELQWMTYLREWHVSGTRISRLPAFLSLFTQLTVLEIPKNTIAELPPEIGKLAALRELNVSYNRLSKVPPELGECENLKRLELTGNHNLSDLPFELSSLKQLVHLDVAENHFVSIPICALRMSGLQLLDLSDNLLTDLPQDMDRLQELVSLFLQKNEVSYLPHCLTNITTLKMIVVNGDALTCCPTALCRNPHIKFIRLCDRASAEKKKKKKKKKEEENKNENKRKRWRGPREEEEEVKDSREKEFIEAYVSSLKDRDTVPESTTKVSISCLL
ncbi:leucine-rich repeat-containing protein 2 [Pseudoliparis swirei]|uniref:leucine-rich repeat-containing protein 2 n=1 Tax=Pseudoliparis swirei TaxID=2059687 RepID=UPI0024BD8A56|nr:leucine-rich repeat-containing protein 2 [Pseudoliparis swirei]XP_056274143.1 leucine-rich repeat-containing protein 2 [Pseudoliparis swirei]